MSRERLKSSWTALCTEDMCLCYHQHVLLYLVWLGWTLVGRWYLQHQVSCSRVAELSPSWDSLLHPRQQSTEKAGTFWFKEGEMSLSAPGLSVSDLSWPIMSWVGKVVSQQRHTRERNAEQVVKTARCPCQHIWSLRLLLLPVSRRRRGGKGVTCFELCSVSKWASWALSFKLYTQGRLAVKNLRFSCFLPLKIRMRPLQEKASVINLQ